MLFPLAAILGSRVFLWRQLLQRLPNLHIVVWRKYDIKNLVLCVVRAYFEISISLKVHKKVYSGIAGWKRIWNVLKPAEYLQKNWRGVDIHNWPANTNERYFIRFLIANFPLKYSYHPIGMRYRTVLYCVSTRFQMTTRPQSFVFGLQQMTFLSL